MCISKTIINTTLLIILFLCKDISAQAVVSLFNKTDLQGWNVYQKGGGDHGKASEMVSVAAQMMRFSGKKIGYLITEKSYTDFELTAEYRWNVDTTFVKRSKTKNSGIMYRVPETARDTIWPKGIQFQVKEGATGDFILLHHTTIDIGGKPIIPGKSVVSKRLKDAAKAIGMWNTVKIICEDNAIEHWLNGELVHKAKNPSVPAGRILLQYEGFPIDFRNVELKEL